MRGAPGMKTSHSSDVLIDVRETGGISKYDEAGASSRTEASRCGGEVVGDRDHWPSIWHEGVGPLQLSPVASDVKAKQVIPSGVWCNWQHS